MLKILAIDPSGIIETQIRTFANVLPINFDVHSVPGTDAANTVLKNGEFSWKIVLADIDSNDSANGINALRELRDSYFGLKYIAVSSDTSFETVKDIMNSQINGFLSKPINSSEFEKLLRAVAPFAAYNEEEMSSMSRAEQNDIVKKNLIHNAMNIIEKELDKDLSLNYVAEKLNISPCYLSALFHKVSGENFMTYVTDYRLEAAARLLVNTNLMINEVASRVGYHNPPYFSTIFKKKYGFIPSRLRGMSASEVDSIIKKANNYEN